MPVNESKYGWWIPSSKVTTNKSANYKQISFPVSYCQVCEQSWEKERHGQNHRKIHIIHYTNLPTNGMKRKVCPDCLKKYI